MKKILILLFVLICCVYSRAQHLITRAEYWFDDAYGSRISFSTTPSATFNYTAAIDCNSLSAGVHVLNTRFMQSDGQWSSVLSHLFLKVPATSGSGNMITALEYWTDNSYASRISQNIAPSTTYNFSTGINFSNLTEGLHVFNIRFRQSDGRWSVTSSQLFLKAHNTNPGDNKIKAYEYWVDNSYTSKVYQAVAPGTNYTMVSGIDYSSLTTGIHVFNIRFLQTDGRWSITQSQLFIKQPVLAGINTIRSYEYWFNNSFENRTRITTPASSLYITSSVLNIDTMSQFLNVLHCRFSDTKGSWTYTEHYFYSLNLNLKLYLQGLYESSTGLMRKAQNASGDNFAGDIADTLSIEIYEGISPYNLLISVNGVSLNTDGTCIVHAHGSNLINSPQSSNTNYYVVVKHRNSIETWSQAILLNSQASYDFTNAITRAYGNNLKQVGTAYVIFGGDVNNDGIVDSGDMLPVDNLSSTFGTGYIPEDANGDGLIDSGDMILVENNSSDFVSVIAP